MLTLRRDITTPSHNFIISPHTRCQNLFIASGGSFHGWKFLPVIGKYIVQMLEGELEEDVARRWHWDEAENLVLRGEKANHTYVIKADLKDLDVAHGGLEIARL
jgi:sarcosine oxidase/L-pipecolate oxidase